MTDDERERVADGIAKLFDGMSLDDVSGILTGQVASLAAQVGGSLSGAMDYLDELYDGASDMLESADFDADGRESRTAGNG